MIGAFLVGESHNTPSRLARLSRVRRGRAIAGSPPCDALGLSIRAIGAA
jgi:hypothetical protein